MTMIYLPRPWAYGYLFAFYALSFRCIQQHESDTFMYYALKTKITMRALYGGTSSGLIVPNSLQLLFHKGVPYFMHLRFCDKPGF